MMMFLEALGKLGEDKALAVLSPLFQDLGLDGICSMPKILLNLAMVCVAPSPRSTRATLIIEAASTYSLTEATVL